MFKSSLEYLNPFAYEIFMELKRLLFSIIERIFVLLYLQFNRATDAMAAKGVLTRRFIFYMKMNVISFGHRSGRGHTWRKLHRCISKLNHYHLRLAERHRHVRVARNHIAMKCVSSKLF